MMMGTKGLGLCSWLRTWRVNSSPSIGFIARSLSTRSDLALAQRVDGGLAMGGLGDFLDADGIEQRPQQRAHMRIVLDNERLQALESGRRSRLFCLATGTGGIVPVSPAQESPCDISRPVTAQHKATGVQVMEVVEPLRDSRQGDGEQPRFVCLRVKERINSPQAFHDPPRAGPQPFPAGVAPAWNRRCCRSVPRRASRAGRTAVSLAQVACLCRHGD